MSTLYESSVKPRTSSLDNFLQLLPSIGTPECIFEKCPISTSSRLLHHFRHTGHPRWIEWTGGRRRRRRREFKQKCRHTDHSSRVLTLTTKDSWVYGLHTHIYFYKHQVYKHNQAEIIDILNTLLNTSQPQVFGYFLFKSTSSLYLIKKS